MFCSSCGKELSNDARFCTRCGAQVQAGDAFAEQPRQPTQPSQGPGLQRILTIAAVFLAVGIAALTGAILAQRQGGSADAAVETRTDDSDKKDEQESDASEQVTAKGNKEDKEDATEAEAAAQKLAEERESLKKQAEANGEQVFVGIVHVCNGERAASILGSEAAYHGNGAKAEYGESMTQHVLLELDSMVSVYVTGWYDGPINKDTDHIQIGQHRYNAYGDSYYGADTASQWNEYDGTRICIAAKDFSLSDGVSVVTVPFTDTARLLYAFDEGEVVPNSASADAQASQTAYDPTQFTYTETTFETMDFIVTVSAEWEGIWEHGTASRQSFGYNWLFSVQDSTAVPGFVGGGICVTSNPNKPSAGGVTERVFDEPSSNGMYLWYVAGDPQGFFEAHGGKATITLK